MKRKRSLITGSVTAVILASLITLSSALTAQNQNPPIRGKGEGNPKACNKPAGENLKGPFGNYANIPGITEKQKEDIKSIRLAMLKDLTSITDQINEKEARLRTLSRADKPDATSIDKLIDEISVLQASKRKRVEKSRQQIRALLNEEQQLWFDQHCQHNANCNPKGLDNKRTKYNGPKRNN